MSGLGNLLVEITSDLVDSLAFDTGGAQGLVSEVGPVVDAQGAAHANGNLATSCAIKRRGSGHLSGVPV